MPKRGAARSGAAEQNPPVDLCLVVHRLRRRN
jgi:hypothetical protein